VTEEKKRLIEYLKLRVKKSEDIMKDMKKVYARMMHEVAKDKLLIQNLESGLV